MARKGLFNILFVLFGLLISISVFAQKKQVSGTVISSEDNLPMPGVTIVLGHDTFYGTTTDFDGKYSIEIPDSTVELVFSFIGMQSQKIIIDGRSVIDVILYPEVLNIDEVVISVPYAKVTKKDFSGSIGVILQDDMAKGMSDNVDKMLQGAAAGVVSSSSSGQPGAKSDVRIRGIGSFQASNEPLYVVDGIPMSTSSGENVLSLINPADIASMTICKDASAASLYGSRASNGIIIITTKKGAKNKTKYSFSTQHAFSQRANSSFSVLNSSEYIELRKEAMQNAGWTNEEIIKEVGSDTLNTDWFEEVFRTSYSSNYEFAVSGGSDSTNFYLSTAYKNEQGIIIGTELERVSLRLNVEHKASDKIELGANINGAVLNQQTIDESGALSSPIVGAYVLQPNQPVFTSEGDYNFANNLQNVVGINSLNQREKQSRSFIGNAFGKYNFNKYLNFKSTFGAEYIFSEQWIFIHPETPDGSAVNGLGELLDKSSNSLTSSNIIAYDKQYRNGSSFGALAGFEVQDFYTKIVETAGSNFATSEVSSLEAAAISQAPSEYTGQWSIMSFLANFRYSINDKYEVTASGRRDYCSRFSENNRAGNFWSAGASWRLSDENFLKNNKSINNLKLRISYGTSGNAEIGDYASLALYSYGVSYASKPGIEPYQLGNENLTWEKNNNADIGLDFRFFKRVSGTLEFYHRTTWDLLMNVPISLTNGYKYQLENFGEMVNKGVELQLITENIKSDKFNWKTDFNISINNNEITELYNNEDIEGQTQIRRVGESYYTFYLPEWAGVNPTDGAAMWYDENGNLTKDYSKAAKIIAGKADPLFVTGFTNSLSYKNIELSFTFFLSYGGKVYNAINQRMLNDGAISGINQSTQALERWRAAGDITSVPKPVYNNGSNSNDISTRYLEDGTFLRLQNIRLTYNLSKELVKKIKISDCKIFVQGSNLWTWTEYSGLDPEVGVNGIDNFAYPSISSASMGLSLNF